MILQTGAQVADKAVQGLLSRIDQLAEKLGTTAANVWTIYVAQARVEAIRDLFVAVFLFLVSGFFFFACGKLSSKNEDGDLVGVAGFLGVAAFVTALFWVYPAIGEFLNPQFWAFQHITADIKGLL